MFRPAMRRWLGVGVLLVAGGAGACKSAPEANAPAERAAAPTAADETPTHDIIAASDLPPPLSSSLPDDPMDVTVHRLSNGMTVYISPDRQKPRFVGWIGVRAGSRNDPADSTGLAHYLEHMLFKGTDDVGTLNAEAEAKHVERVADLYAQLRQTDDAAERERIFEEIDAQTQAMAKYAIPNELDRVYSELGVQGLNAYTSFDETVYIADVPANRFESWARMEAERFADPVFRLFYPELEAVYEEKNLSLDNPGRRVSEAMYASLYPEHPYGTQTTIGSVEHLKTPAYQDMVDYFHRWYVPNNMAVVLSGDIDAKTVLPILERTLGRLEPKPVSKPSQGRIVPLEGRKVTEVVAEGDEQIRLAWHAAPAAAEDEPALDVLDRILDDAKVGLLNVELELTQKVPAAGSWYSPDNDAGHFAVYAQARHDQDPAALEQELLDVIEKVKRGEFSEADVEAVKVQESVRRKLELETPWARAAHMMNSFIRRQSWQDVVRRDQRFQEVTREDVIAAANEYLSDDYVVVVKRKGQPDIPKLEKPDITPVEIDSSRRSPFAQSIIELPSPVLEPQWTVEGEHYARKPLAAGELIAARNDRNDLFTVRYQMHRGFRDEPLLCYALDLFELSGAGNQEPEDVQKHLYRLGSEIDSGCNDDMSWIEVSGTDAQLEASLAILDEWLAKPRFDQETLDRLYENTITHRRDDLDQTATLTAALDQYAKYGKDSAWLNAPSNTQLRRATPSRLRRLISTVLDHEHQTLYFGPRSAEEAAGVLARGKRPKKTDGLPRRTYRKVSGPQIFFLHKPGAKANVRFVLPQGSLPRDQRPLARLFSEYLSGNMSALVFQEIREARGLAYTAFSVYDWGRLKRDETGLVGLLSTQADKTPTAVETFLELLRKDTLQGERLRAAKVALDQEYRATRIDPRYVVHNVVAWDLLGEPSDPRPWMWEANAKLELEQAEAFAQRFADVPAIIAVIGDRERVNLEALEQIAPVTEVPKTDLFGYGSFPAKPQEKRAANEDAPAAHSRSL